MPILLGELSVNIRADNSRFSGDLSSARSAGDNFAKNFSSKMQSIGDSIQGTGAALTKYITGPLTIATTAVFKFGKDFEKELSKVVGLVGVARKQVDEWGNEILDLAPQLGKAPKELAEALFFVTSAGIKGAEAMDVLTKAGKASAAGLGETKTIADLVTSAMNAYGKENLSAAKATDIIAMAVRQGKAEAAELAASMGQVLPLASEMGVTFDQVAAAQASMTRTGTNASEAATQLKSIMAGLIKPAKQAEEQLENMGTSSAELRKKIKNEGLLTTLGDLRKMTNKYGEEAMARVFPNIRALMGVLDLMGSNAESNVEIFKEVSNSTGTLEDAFSAASETLDFKWNQALSKGKATAITFFSALKERMIPVLEIVMNVLDFVIAKFKQLPDGVKNGIMTFLGIVAAVGPVLLGLGTVVGLVAGTIGAVGAAVSTLSALLAAIAAPAAVVVAVLIGMAAQASIVIGVIVGMIATFKRLFDTNKAFKENVLNTWRTIKENGLIIFNEIKRIAYTVIDGIRKFWAVNGDKIMNAAMTVWNGILGFIRLAMTQIRNVIQLISAIIRGDWSVAWAAIKRIFATAIRGMISAAKAMVRAFISIFKALGPSVWSLVKAMINRVGSLLSALWNKGKQAAKKFVSAILNTNFVKAGRAIIDGVIKGIKQRIGALNRWASEMAATVRNKLPFSPAKEGPLKDLNKIDFATSINKALEKTRKKINMPSLKVGSQIMGNLTQGANIGAFGANKGFNVNNMNIYGIQDMFSFMDEMKMIVQKHTGRSS